MELNIDILTLFPEMFDIFEYSIIGRARRNEILDINTHNIRDYSKNKHNKTDDYTYGGGQGMLMTVEPLFEAIDSIKKINPGKVVFLGPRGKKYDQEMAKNLAKEKNLIFVCGHYEGIDERVYEYIDLEISLGDFVLTGGEMACIPIVDSISRLVPGVLAEEASYEEESFYNGALEYPQYTRPECFRGKSVPGILLSGHHENIRKWRREQSLILTKKLRPDLFKKIQLSKEDKKLLNNHE
ncbi:tRNA (guanosine(37)-N1)-methyltransferase TrmD [Clostridium akagii]|uniref:tRNA (guanosine(37)-N1)-methyltransferase TrmD n=1 Tax=Clostridium akagii TaxID=91623 RepID=UPI00047B2A13|nr:tRNA (guanosine(37)-N1)-methyltransferase TrmD [Clostridium akagii]